MSNATNRLRDSNNRLEAYLDGVPSKGPSGPGAYNPPPPVGAGYPEASMPRPRRLTDHELAVATLLRLRNKAERDGFKASADVYDECLRRLRVVSDPRDAK